MLKEFVEKIASMAENKTYQINGDTYSDNALYRIEPHVDAPQEIQVYGLDGLVKIIQTELSGAQGVFFVSVKDYKTVSVFSSIQEKFRRDFLYTVRSIVGEYSFGWKDYEEAMISLRSQFIPNEGVTYLLDILSKITDENSVTSEDNGLTQQVEARKGIALAAKETVNPIVKLIPYRTFLEVEQPESEFLVRLREGGRIGLFEADGGMWKLKAAENIKAYLSENLKDLVEDHTVVIMG